MGLYLGDSRVKLNFNNTLYNLNLYSSTLILNGAILKSIDDYILKDFNGLYLTAKEDE